MKRIFVAWASCADSERNSDSIQPFKFLCPHFVLSGVHQIQIVWRMEQEFCFSFTWKKINLQSHRSCRPFYMFWLIFYTCDVSSTIDLPRITFECSENPFFSAIYAPLWRWIAVDAPLDMNCFTRIRFVAATAVVYHITRVLIYFIIFLRTER